MLVGALSLSFSVSVCLSVCLVVALEIRLGCINRHLQWALCSATGPLLTLTTSANFVPPIPLIRLYVLHYTHFFSLMINFLINQKWAKYYTADPDKIFWSLCSEINYYLFLESVLGIFMWIIRVYLRFKKEKKRAHHLGSLCFLLCIKKKKVPF